VDRIFLCYRRDDGGGYAGNLYRDLRREFGRQVFQDVHRSLPGDSYREQIDATLARCAVVVVVVGPDWLRRDEYGRRRLDDQDDLVRFEIATALRRPGLVVLPVQVGGAALPRRADLPEELQPLLDRTTYRIDEGPQRESHLEFLIHAIGRHLDAHFAVPAALAAVLAVAAVMAPARVASSALREGWEPLAEPDAPDALLRLGALHGVEWALLAAFAAASATLVARGARGARRALAVGALAGALGGLVGGALDQRLRAFDHLDLGIVVGVVITASVAGAAGLAGRRSTGAVVAAGLGALLGALIARGSTSENWVYAAPVIGTIVAVATVRLAAADSPLRSVSTVRQFGRARDRREHVYH
jgi:hypothetical protein